MFVPEVFALSELLVIVPLLYLVLCVRTGLRRGDIEPEWECMVPLLREPRRRKS